MPQYSGAMRRVLVPLLAVPIGLALAPSASAAPLSLGGEFGLKTQVVPAAQNYGDTEYDRETPPYPTTNIYWIGSCDGAEQGCSIGFAVTFKGKTVFAATDEGDGLGDSANDAPDDSRPGDFDYSRDWSSCKRSGLYRWAIDVDYDDPDADSPMQTLKRTGSFRIPNCRKPKTRKVSAGNAAGFLNDELGDRYDGEFISQVRCGSGRRTKFHCSTKHNNNYRECSQGVTVRALRTNRFGRKDNSYTTSYGKNRCHSF